MLFVLVYGIVFTMGIYYINRLIARGPQRRAARATGTRHASVRPQLKAAARLWSRRAMASDREADASEACDGMVSAGDLGRVIGIAVAMYVILDGFDLGIGILFPFASDEQRARPDDEFGRAVLGRQRDLAGARRGRTVGRLSAAPTR